MSSAKVSLRSCVSRFSIFKSSQSNWLHRRYKLRYILSVSFVVKSRCRNACKRLNLALAQVAVMVLELSWVQGSDLRDLDIVDEYHRGGVYSSERPVDLAQIR